MFLPSPSGDQSDAQDPAMEFEGIPRPSEERMGEGNAGRVQAGSGMNGFRSSQIVRGQL
jgi:hypothetical protein